MWSTANVFKAGHRIRLEVSSSNFPRFDRNPNTGQPKFADAEIRPAMQTIMHNHTFASYLTLPLIQLNGKTGSGSALQRMASASKFAFVLYRPQSAGNIGAAARALKNMGFDDFRLVGLGPLNDREAVKMAVHADDILANATVYPDLAAAIADCSIAVGTTSRRGGYRSRSTPLRPAAVELDALAGTNKIAIVFGREDRGLTNRELKLCHRLVTIPTAPEYPSLNRHKP